MSHQHTIHALDPTTVRRIHSGQVIVSMESIVKELVENALDATATRIEVRMINKGLTLLQVKDDGHGMDAHSRTLVGQRYHTSKIASIDDLNHIHTLGFRGEAINSMCAVSANVQLTTKTATDKLAMQYALDRSGNQSSEKPSGRIPRSGTIVSVFEPFIHLPVRRQVCEKSFSFKRLQELLTKYALAYPSVRFSIASAQSDSRVKEVEWIKPAAPDTITAIALAYGPQLADSVEYHRVEDVAHPLAIECVLPKPNSDPSVVCRSDPVHVNVNRRPVSYMQCELKEAVALVRRNCNPNTSSKKTPFMYLNIQLDGSQFDVNVDPNKSAVLFHNHQQVIDLLQTLLNKVYTSPPESLFDDQRSTVSPSPQTSHPPLADSNTAIAPSVANKDSLIQSSASVSNARPPPPPSREALATFPSPVHETPGDDNDEQGLGRGVENDEGESIGAWKFSMGSQDTSTSSEEQDQLIPSEDDAELQITERNSGPRVPTLSEWLQRPSQQPSATASSSTRKSPARKPTRIQEPAVVASPPITHALRRYTQQTTIEASYRNAQQAINEKAHSNAQQTTHQEYQWQIESDPPSTSTTTPLQQRDLNIQETPRQRRKPATLDDMFRMQKAASTPPASTGKGKGREQPVATPSPVKNIPKKRKRNTLLTGKSKPQSLYDTLNFELPITCDPSAVLANYASQHKRHDRYWHVQMDRYPSPEGSVKDMRRFPLLTETTKPIDVYVKTRRQASNIHVEEVGVMDGDRMKYACSLSWHLKHHALTPNRRLEKPIKIEISKEDPYFQVISSLKMNERTQIDCDGSERLFGVVNDPRLVSNGFQCRWRMIDRATMLLQITSIHIFDTDYGLPDFRELLSIIQEQPWMDDLSHCRPSSVEEYYRQQVLVDASSPYQRPTFCDDVLRWDDYVTDSGTYHVGISDLLEDNPIVCCTLYQPE